MGHGIPLGRVAGAGRGAEGLRRVRAGGQVRGGDGLPVPVGGDRWCGSRRCSGCREDAWARLPGHRGGARWMRGGGSSSGRTGRWRCRRRRRMCGRWRSGWCPPSCGPRWPRGSRGWSPRRAATSATGFLSTPYLLPVLADHGYLDAGLRAAAPGHAAVLADDGGPGRDDRVGGVGRGGRARRRRTRRSTTTARARWLRSCTATWPGCVPASRDTECSRYAPGQEAVSRRRARATSARSARLMSSGGCRPARWNWTCRCPRVPRPAWSCPARLPQTAAPGRHHWTGAQRLAPPFGVMGGRL